jgi:hypothetical protein
MSTTPDSIYINPDGTICHGGESCQGDCRKAVDKGQINLAAISEARPEGDSHYQSYLIGALASSVDPEVMAKAIRTAVKCVEDDIIRHAAREEAAR